MRTFTINGEARQVEPNADTVGQLLDALGVAHQTVAVMINGQIVARETFSTHMVKAHDQIEVVRFVGGG